MVFNWTDLPIDSRKGLAQDYLEEAARWVALAREALATVPEEEAVRRALDRITEKTRAAIVVVTL